MHVKEENSGGDNDYWVVDVRYPKRLQPYQAECEDIIRALGMTFDEGEAFKALWRKAMQRTYGKAKKGNTALRDAEKVAHYGQQMERIERLTLAESREYSSLDVLITDVAE